MFIKDIFLGILKIFQFSLSALLGDYSVIKNFSFTDQMNIHSAVSPRFLEDNRNKKY